MNDDMTVLDVARRRLDLSVLDLWIAYFAIGGHADAPTLDSYLQGHTITADTDYNLIAHALNEHFSERGQDRPVPYRDV